MKWILFVLVFFSISSLAQTGCQELNLISEKNSPFAKLPVYDQDGIGMCYAYAAAQLIDFELIRSGGKRSVHPLWAALRYSKYENKVSGGVVADTIQEIMMEGNCDEKIIRANLLALGQTAGISDAELISLIEILSDKLQESRVKRKSSSLTPEDIDRSIRLAIKEQRKFCSGTESMEKLIPQLKALTSFTTSRKMLEEMIFDGCHQKLSKLKLPYPSAVTLGSDDLSELKNRLHSLQSPVSISFCANVLFDPSYDGINERFPGMLDSRPDCGKHEALIVGKKLIGGACHLLLRNSWGTNFGKWTSNWKCLCRNRQTGELKDNCTSGILDYFTSEKFVVEGCWVPESALARNAYKFTSLGTP